MCTKYLKQTSCTRRSSMDIDSVIPLHFTCITTQETRLLTRRYISTDMITNVTENAMQIMILFPLAALTPYEEYLTYTNSAVAMPRSSSNGN